VETTITVKTRKKEITTQSHKEIFLAKTKHREPTKKTILANIPKEKDSLGRHTVDIFSLVAVIPQESFTTGKGNRINKIAFLLLGLLALDFPTISRLNWQQE